MTRFLSLIAAILVLAAPVARAQNLSALVQALPEGSFSDRAETIRQIGFSGTPLALEVLTALAAGDLVKLSDTVVVRTATGDFRNPLTGTRIPGAEAGRPKKIRLNNSVRRALQAALGMLTLRDPDPAKRQAAALDALQRADPEQIEALDAAQATETDPSIAVTLQEARAAAILHSDAGREAKLEAIAILSDRGDDAARAALFPFGEDADPDIAAAATGALDQIARTQRLWSVGQNIWFGLSLGSILLLAAVGLAITFGVMGVINMAHGELVMVGAYTTVVVQGLVAEIAPGLVDVSLLLALPLAFVTAGAVGIAIERGIVRHLYGRPLETLLATWGVSLILQQGVRSIFGPSNRQVTTPSWMSDSFDIGQIQITWNRLAILIFALAVFAVLLVVLRRTRIGLQMRAVTQNRAMAANMGIKTGRLDALTFGLGSGIAGLAGVALTQIDNVSPNLGQGYIVDSFMVVVFGGAGSIWGTFVGALSLGTANKFLEPFAGAVLAKILILVGIILFIQKRPRGLIAIKGRAVDS